LVGTTVAGEGVRAPVVGLVAAADAVVAVDGNGRVVVAWGAVDLAAVVAPVLTAPVVALHAAATAREPVTTSATMGLVAPDSRCHPVRGKPVGVGSGATMSR
jgi:hypothetical protein